jgi:hypothetical protein
VNIFCFGLDEYQTRNFFQVIRSKEDIISIWMEFIKIALVNIKIRPERSAGKIVLAKNKMSRLFFVANNKCFSVNFPFNVHNNNGFFEFYTYNAIAIENKESSDIISILNIKQNNTFVGCDVYKFFEVLFDICEYNQEIWQLFRYLMLQEDGYLRYDHDPEHEDGKFHPLNHIDICYSNSASFKIGMEEIPNYSILLDIFDRNTYCYLLRRQ